jgi:dTDP-glucose 4,6-dehydratase
VGRPDTLVRHVPDRQGHDRRYCLDSSRLRALGWAPAIPFGTGLEQTVEWYTKNEWWWRPIKEQDAAFRAYYEQQYGASLS